MEKSSLGCTRGFVFAKWLEQPPDGGDHQHCDDAPIPLPETAEVLCSMLIGTP